MNHNIYSFSWYYTIKQMIELNNVKLYNIYIIITLLFINTIIQQYVSYNIVLIKEIK